MGQDTKRTKKHKPKSKYTVTERQMRVLESAAECGLKESITSIAKRAGVRRQAIYEWLNPDHRLYDEKFLAKWDELAMYIVRTAVPTTVGAMRNRAASGDVAAGKVILEMHGSHTPKQKVELTGKDGNSLDSRIAFVDVKELQKPANLAPVMDLAKRYDMIDALLSRGTNKTLGKNGNGKTDGGESSRS